MNGQRDGMRRLQEALRALEDRAVAVRKAMGMPWSRNEAARSATKLFSTMLDARRIGDWLAVPGRAPRDPDQVWALVRVWAEWAGEPNQRRTYWNELVENAQPVGRHHAQGAAGAGRGASGTPATESMPPASVDTLQRRWNLPARHRDYVGRTAMLDQVRREFERHRSVQGAISQALYGIGGVGKTQMAVEYAYRYAADYALVWWIPAEQPTLVLVAFDELADALGIAPNVDQLRRARSALAMLRNLSSWLLIFDNVDDPADLAHWRPPGKGHVLYTGRSRRLQPLGTMVEVQPFQPDESLQLLQNRVSQLGEAEATSLAEALGQLPLALEQAAAYLAVTKVPIATYLRLLEVRMAEALIERPVDYPHSVVASVSAGIDWLAIHHPGALAVLQVAAFWSAEPVPAVLLDATVRRLCGAELDLSAVVRALDRQALARYDGATLQIHRLTQAIVRDSVRNVDIVETAQDILAGTLPRDHTDAQLWSMFGQLTPHVLAMWARAGSADTESFRRAVVTVNAYLRRSGQVQAAHKLSVDAHQRWLNTLGSNHQDTLHAALGLAADLRLLGEHSASRHLNEQTLATRRRLLGNDHPDTLKTAHNLARDLWDLREHTAARRLDEDTLARRTRLLGEHHPDTLYTAKSLARDLYALGEHQAAHDLDQATLQQMHRVLGDDHPYTMTAAHNLALDLMAIGRHHEASRMAEETLARRRRVLGVDHPYTILSEQTLAEARQLQTAGRKPPNAGATL